MFECCNNIIDIITLKKLMIPQYVYILLTLDLENKGYDARSRVAAEHEYMCNVSSESCSRTNLQTSYELAMRNQSNQTTNKAEYLANYVQLCILAAFSN